MVYSPSEKELGQGTSCRVLLDEQGVKKIPLKIPPAVLAQRLEEMRKLMLQALNPEIDPVAAERLLPKCKLAEDGAQLYLRQRLVKGCPLWQIPEPELLTLGNTPKIELIKILTHYLITTRCCRHLTPDIFGYSKDFKGAKKYSYTLNPRFSDNIWLSEEGEITMPDFDQYFRPERSRLKQVLARRLTPVMRFYAAYFREKLRLTLDLKQTFSFQDELLLEGLKDPSLATALWGMRLQSPAELVKLYELRSLYTLFSQLLKFGQELVEFKDVLLKLKGQFLKGDLGNMNLKQAYRIFKHPEIHTTDFPKITSGLGTSKLDSLALNISHQTYALSTHAYLPLEALRRTFVSAQQFNAVRETYPNLAPMFTLLLEALRNVNKQRENHHFEKQTLELSNLATQLSLAMLTHDLPPHLQHKIPA